MRRAVDHRRARASTAFLGAIGCVDAARSLEPAPCALAVQSAQAALIELPERGPREIEAVAALADLDAARSKRDVAGTARALDRARRAAVTLGWHR